MGLRAGAGSVMRRRSATIASAPMSPTAAPIAISTTNSRRMTNLEASSCVASSIIPIMRAMPAGSFTPASPSSVTPERPLISRWPSTENITAGSVGASAAPMTPAVIHSNPST